MQTCLKERGSVCFMVAVMKQNILIVVVKPPWAKGYIY